MVTFLVFRLHLVLWTNYYKTPVAEIQMDLFGVQEAELCKKLYIHYIILYSLSVVNFWNVISWKSSL